MSKLVCITKEIKEGINRLEVGHICPNEDQPSPYPYTIFMEVDLEVKTPQECCINATPKYEVDVDVKFNKEGYPSFKLVSGLIEKTNLLQDARYIAETDKLREKEYAEKVDKLVIEKLRKQLKDPEIDAIVNSIQAKYPKGV